MRQFTIATVLTVLFLSVLVAPMPSEETSEQTYTGAIIAARNNDITGCGLHGDNLAAVPNWAFNSGNACGKVVTITANGGSVKCKVGGSHNGGPFNSIAVAIGVFEELIASAVAKFGETVEGSWSIE
ncbi:hypothetical protein V8E55_002394 [Tylopilus felleus]